MTLENREKAETNSNAIHDLTLEETKTEAIKGGNQIFVPGSFSFGVEREMKESGEKGGTE